MEAMPEAERWDVGWEWLGLENGREKRSSGRGSPYLYMPAMSPFSLVCCNLANGQTKIWSQNLAVALRFEISGLQAGLISITIEAELEAPFSELTKPVSDLGKRPFQLGNC